MAADIQVLSAGQGYGIVVGLGIGFVIIMIGLTFVQNKFTSMDSFKSEEFNVASRTVKPGLIASGIISAWTHPGTFLNACTLAYKYGVAGPMWIGANGAFQILFFALAAIKLKRVANTAHTFPELVKQRHGTAAHIIFTLYAFACNIITGVTLMAGGAATFHALTGVNIWAMYFVFPFVCTAYIVVGGLRSTFINDYIHTVILFVIILVFAFEIYVVYPGLGSIDNMWARLNDAQTLMPSPYNYKGSYLTIASRTAVINNLSLFLSSFASVWMDQAFWQRIIASEPRTTVKAYLLGGWAWYGVPFSFATAIGLACVAVEAAPELWPYDAKLTTAQINAGLVAPALITAIMGQHGALILLILLFMATTSSTSAEIIAASSIWTFDVYKSYINPQASSNKLVQISMWALGGYSLVLAGFSCLFNGVGVSLGWLSTCAAVLVGSGAAPLMFILLWDRTSTAAAIFGPVIGFFGGMIGWFVTAYKLNGAVTVATTLSTYNIVAGDVAAIVISTLATVILTFLFPHIRETSTPEEEYPEKPTGVVTTTPVSNTGDADEIQESPSLHGEYKYVPRQAVTAKEASSGFWRSYISLNIFAIIFLVIWPFSLYGTHYIFSLAFFRFWVILAFIWVFFSAIIAVILPLWESRVAMLHILKALLGKKGAAKDVGATF